MSGKKSGTDSSTLTQLEILAKYDCKNLSLRSQRDATAALGISQPSLCKILKRRESLNGEASQSNGDWKRKFEGKFNDIGEALLAWFRQVTAKNVPMDEGLLKEKATLFAEKLGIADFVASDGCYRGGKPKMQFFYTKLHGEKEDYDVPGAENWLKLKWPTVVDRYDPENIFNMDKMGLYYRATPEYCLQFKNAIATAGKKN